MLMNLSRDQSSVLYICDGFLGSKYKIKKILMKLEGGAVPPLFNEEKMLIW
jgi:hypothetical protein